jgi:hypothetical protein
MCVFLESSTHRRPRDDSHCEVGVFDAVRENAGCISCCWAAVLRDERHFHCYPRFKEHYYSFKANNDKSEIAKHLIEKWVFSGLH